MGFFDSFKKKGEVSAVSTGLNNQNKVLDLPPPPLPKKNMSNDNKKGPVFDMPPLPPAPAFPAMPPPQVQPVKKEVAPDTKKDNLFMNQPDFKMVAQNKPSGNESNFEFKQKDLSLNIPDSLPEIPSLQIQQIPQRDFKGKDIPSFDMDIPGFNEDGLDMKKELDVLPSLDIFDSEEETPRTNFRHSEIRKPLFIRTDYYSDVLSTIDTMKSYVNESSEIIYGLENLKKNWDIEHRNYKDTLEDIQRKLIYIDKVLFEKEG